MTRTYECSNCGHIFENEEKMGVAARKKCPNCKKHTLVRKIESTNIHFNGSGFSRKLG